MSLPVTSKAFISTGSAIFIYFFIFQINYNEVAVFLKMKGTAGNEIDFIETMEIFGAITGGVLLAQLVNIYSKLKILISCQLVYFICTINLTILENKSLLIVNLMLMSLGRFIFYAVTLLKFVEHSRDDKLKGLTLYCFIWAVTFVCGYYSVQLLATLKVSNVFLSSAFIQLLIITGILFYNKNFILVKNRKVNFRLLISAMESEILMVFAVSYIIFSFYWDWESFAVDKGYVITEIEDVKFYMIFGVLISLYPIKLLINSCSRFKLNLYIMIGLICSLIMIQIAEKYTVTYPILIFNLQGALLYFLFLNNLIILTEKFTDIDLDYVITLYLSMGITGSYIGIIATDNMMETFGSYGFLTSIYSISIILFAYYLSQFISRRLYKS